MIFLVTGFLLVDAQSVVVIIVAVVVVVVAHCKNCEAKSNSNRLFFKTYNHSYMVHMTFGDILLYRIL
jgi:hypothetical protein